MLTQHLSRSNQYTTAIFLMLLSSFFVAFSALLGKWLVNSIDLPTLIFFRFLLPALILWWVVLITGTFTFNKQCIVLNAARALFVVLSQYALFYYLMKEGSVLNATLLLMTSPLFIPFILKILQKTPIKSHQWISIIVGFIGVIFILKPSRNILDGYAVVGLASGLFNACSQVYYHKISKQSDINNATLMMYSFAAITALIPGIIFWHAIPKLLSPVGFHSNLSFLLLLIVMAITVISSQSFRGRAYSRVNKAISLTPFMYTAIIFSGIFDWFAFKIVPDFLSIIGAILIVSSGLILFIVKFKKTSEEIAL